MDYAAYWLLPALSFHVPILRKGVIFIWLFFRFCKVIWVKHSIWLLKRALKKKKKQKNKTVALEYPPWLSRNKSD